MSDHSTEIKEIEEALKNICTDWVGIGIQMSAAGTALLELKRFTSIGAPPERKRGHWVVCGKYSIECSECGMRRAIRTKFCSECGADMRGGENETD